MTWRAPGTSFDSWVWANRYIRCIAATAPLCQSAGRGNDQVFGGPGKDRIYGEPGNDRIVDLGGATTVYAGSGTNRVDVGDRHNDDRLVCAPGSTNHIVADRHDRIARSCRGKGSTIRYVCGRHPRSAH